MRASRFELRRPRLAPLLALPVVVVGLVGVIGTGATQRSGARPTSGSATAGDEISIEGFAFAPSSIEVESGTTVVWTNRDAAEHTVEDTGGLFEESDELRAGDAFRFEYAQPGRYPYFCGIHASMRGEVVVRR